MNLLYGAFAIIISLAIISNIFTQQPSDKPLLVSDTLVWSISGVPYLILFLTMMFYNTAPFWAIASFHVLVSACYVWQFRMLEYKKSYVTTALPIGLMVFVLAWTAMACYLGMERFVILVPSVLVSAVVSLMLAAYFFMRSDKEVQLKSNIAILYSILAVVKIMYLINTNNQEPKYFIGVIMLEFMIYLITAVLILMNSYYKELIRHSLRGKVIGDMLGYADQPIALLNQEGALLFGNDFLKKDMASKAIKINNLKDLLDNYGPEDYMEWYQQSLQSFVNGDSCLLTLPVQKDKLMQTYIFCDVVPSRKKYNILFSMRSYPVDTEWAGKGRRSIDLLTNDGPIDLLSEGFELLANSDIKEKLGLLLVRLTNFSSIENKLGEELKGDFMAAMMGFIGSTEGVGKIGLYKEDTFIVISKEMSFEKIHDLAEKLVHKLAESYSIDHLDVSMSPDLGVAIYPDNGNDYTEMTKAAQIALARSTAGKGSRIQYYESDYKFIESDRIDLENDLRSAIKNDEFHVLFQPQVWAKDQTFRGFEVLIRWEKKGLVSVSPELFISLAEDLGIIEDVGLWVLDHAIGKASSWQNEFGIRFMMSVNISSVQLEKPYFVNQVRELLEKHKYPAKNLELEVTESKILRTSKEVYENLKEFKEMEIKIALDDFGTGYSSLDYLRWLPFDVLKIDKSFIDNLAQGSIEREIVYSVISLVNKLNLETVAEGVENEEQLQFLKEAGCTYIQGYLFSQPLTEFEARESLLTID